MHNLCGKLCINVQCVYLGNMFVIKMKKCGFCVQQIQRGHSRNTCQTAKIAVSWKHTRSNPGEQSQREVVMETDANVFNISDNEEEVVNISDDEEEVIVSMLIFYCCPSLTS